MKKIVKKAAKIAYIVAYYLYYRQLPIFGSNSQKVQTNKNKVNENLQLLKYVVFWDNFNIELYKKIKIAHSNQSNNFNTF